MTQLFAACLMVWVSLFWMTVEARGASPAIDPNFKAAAHDRDFCLECHEAATVKTLEATPHARLSCLACHPQAAKNPHADQPRVDCRVCHRRHGETEAHDAHLSVTCQACHFKGVVPIREPATGFVGWQVASDTNIPFQPHLLAAAGRQEACRRCHIAGNTVGAAAAILPGKGLLCLSCHPATLAIGDTVTFISLGLFFIGLVWLISIYFSGNRFQGRHPADDSTGRAKTILAVIFYDVLLQRRLWRRSPRRWAIHGLIFYGMLFRFLWGLTAKVFSGQWPENGRGWVLLDINAPLTAFLFDLTGVMIILGVLLAGLRRTRTGLPTSDGLPRRDWWALALLGGAVVLGFIVEGVRIAMTGTPPGSRFAFLGVALSRLWGGYSGLIELYPWLWYIHAGLWGTFVAYIPFSRMVHIILAPVVLIGKAARKR